MSCYSQWSWQDIFGNPNPVEVEIGPGKGAFFLAAAQAHSDRNYFGIEKSPKRARQLREQIEKTRLPNAMVICADSACVTAHLIPSKSVSAYHIYFPDPWWKRRHHKRRLFRGAFCEHLYRTLLPGGKVFLMSDLEGYLEEIKTQLKSADLYIAPFFRENKKKATNFEEKYLRQRKTLYYAAFIRSTS